MKIAIHAADLDADRIDGTRIYIKSVLDYFGKISPEDNFIIAHKSKFNNLLEPKKFSNYSYFKKNFPFSWTQTMFAFELWKNKPDVLWMPVHNLPFFRRKALKTVVTIHDLAFKIYPEYFTKKDLRKLNFLADYSIKNSNRIIAVSQSTKNDILRFYPNIDENKIRVIYHGFDAEIFQKEISLEESRSILNSYNLEPKKYLLYVGAIQPRKNLKILIKSFEKIKKDNPKIKLVLAGEKAWIWEETIRIIENSEFSKDIILTGRIDFEKIACLYRNAKIFVFPSIYEGFGIPILEAFASGVPVISANNSSLLEIGNGACMFFNSSDAEDLTEKIKKLLSDEKLCLSLIEKGKNRLIDFSWEKCARETLDLLKE